MASTARTIERRWPTTPAVWSVLSAPRTDLLTEASCATDDGSGDDGVTQADDDQRRDRPLEFVQHTGPFREYRRIVYREGDELVERITYRYRLPVIGWLVALPVRWQLARRGGQSPTRGEATMPWWAPPDQLDARQLNALGLLVTASIAAAYLNSLFSQTAAFAADEFGIGDAALGWAGGIVRVGIVISLPLAVAADRLGRQRVIGWVAVAAPIVCALGALSPSFALLVATQTLGRPLAITLDMLLAVVAAEEMPKSSRAYAVAVMAMAYGLGAGLVTMGLTFAELGPRGWRIEYGLALVWLVVAAALRSGLPESIRFERPHRIAPRLQRGRLLLVGATVVLGNLFVAPAAFYLNRYLSDVRDLRPSTIALFTLSVGTPAGLGIVVGGKLAEVRGRRLLIACALPLSTALVVTSYTVAGFAMWFAAFSGGFIAGVGAPAMLVYRTELFPTGNRGRATGVLTAAALFSGSVSIVAVGQAIERGVTFATALAVCGVGQLIVVALVVGWFPESAHRELEELNPLDAATAASTL